MNAVMEMKGVMVMPGEAVARTRRGAVRLALAGVVAFGVGTAVAETSVQGRAVPLMLASMDHSQHQSMSGDHAQHQMMSGDEHAGHQDMSGDEHAMHRQMMQRQGYTRSAHDYRLPNLMLRDSDGSETTLAQTLGTDKPVLLNFIYTTCTTICPVLSATFSQVQRDLGSEADQVRMVSISIDPDRDTPQQLREYAQRFGAGPQWRFITGDRDNIVEVQKAFDIYRGAKTNHEPVTLMRASKADSWVRIEGIASAKEIINEYNALPSMTQ